MAILRPSTVAIRAIGGEVRSDIMSCTLSFQSVIVNAKGRGNAYQRVILVGILGVVIGLSVPERTTTHPRNTMTWVRFLAALVRVRVLHILESKRGTLT